MTSFNLALVGCSDTLDAGPMRLDRRISGHRHRAAEGVSTETLKSEYVPASRCCIARSDGHRTTHDEDLRRRATRMPATQREGENNRPDPRMLEELHGASIVRLTPKLSCKRSAQYATHQLACASNSIGGNRNGFP